MATPAQAAPAAPAPAAPAAQQASVSIDLSGDTCVEIGRYFLYLLDFIFGVLMWGLVADKALQGGKCYGFSDVETTVQGGFIYSYAESSPLCAVIIAFGVIMMLLLLAAIVWHSFIFFNKPFMPYLVEGILFSCMSLMWFILGISAVAKSPGYVRSEFSEMRALIAGGWLAGFTHLGNAVIAFIQRRSTGGKGSLPTSVPAPAPTAVPQPAAVPQAQYTPSTPQQYAAPPPQQQYGVPMQQPQYAAPTQPVQAGVAIQVLPVAPASSPTQP